MNYLAIQQNGVVSRKEMMSFVSMADSKDSVVCPRPRRVVNTTCFNDPSRSRRWHLGQQAELADARVGSELLDIILSKGGQGPERPSLQVASSPPFFCGSPPSRVSNPLIQDARFREEEKQSFPPISPLPSLPIPATPGSASSTNYSSSRKGGCIRANFGNNPAVRVEGFDCLDRDRRNCSIPTFA